MVEFLPLFAGGIELGILVALGLLFGGYKLLPKALHGLGRATREPERGFEEHSEGDDGR
jgi:Sec-independent protein translocase protein TatA